MTPNPKPPILTSGIAKALLRDIKQHLPVPPRCEYGGHPSLEAIATEKTKVVQVRSEDEWMDQFDLLHPASAHYRCTWANGEKGYEPGYFDQWHGYLGALRSLGLVAATRDA